MKAVKELTECAYKDWNVRVFGTKEEPWFVAIDVLRALGVHPKNISRELKRLDSDEKTVVNLTTVTGQKEAWLISEPGFYKVALTAQTEEAKKFQRWVTHEVLPRIRKYGYYKLTNHERKMAAFRSLAENLGLNSIGELDSKYGKMPLYRLEAADRELKYEIERKEKEAKLEEEKQKLLKKFPYTEEDIESFGIDVGLALTNLRYANADLGSYCATIGTYPNEITLFNKAFVKYCKDGGEVLDEIAYRKNYLKK